MRTIRARTGDGRLSQRIARILTKGGYQVEAFYPAEGVWRHPQYDVMSWEVSLIEIATGNKIMAGCWETMTEFAPKAARYGFHLGDDDEIWPNPSPEEIAMQPKSCGVCGGQHWGEPCPYEDD